MFLCAASLPRFLAAQRQAHAAEPAKTYTYDIEQMGRWNNFFGIDRDLEAARKRNQKRDDNPKSRGLFDFVTISGNWGFTFRVRGPGNAYSALPTTDISMDTNQQLTITTSNSGSIVASANVARANAGSVDYEFSILLNGTTVDGPDTGTDAGANGKTLIVPNPGILTPKVYTFRIRRRVNLTEEAKGGETYTATGRITITIN